MYYLLNIVKEPPGPGIPRATHDSAMVPAAARPLPLVPCKSWSHEHAALWNGSSKFPRDGRLDGRASPQGWTASQGHGAALHGGSSCKVRWSMLPRPQRAQLSAAHCPRRAGVERSTSSTSSFNASTGTASAWRRPPALLGRRPDATTGRLGPVAAHAVRLVPSAASVRAWKVGGLLFFLLCEG